MRAGGQPALIAPRPAFLVLCSTLLAAGASAPVPAAALAVSGPGDLTAAEFWVYVDGGAAFPRVEHQGPEPVAIEITDPVVGGVPLTGHFLLDAEALPTGPATKVNATLSSPAGAAVTADVELAAFVTFDVAVLSATLASAPVRFVGQGLGGSAGHQGDGLSGSTSNAAGYVTLYETNGAGGFGAIVRTWEVRDDFTSTPIDEVVSLATNQLYRIVIRSLANVDLRSPTSLEQYAYLFIDPTLSLAASGIDAELVASANLPEAVPEPASGPAAAVAALAFRALVARRRGLRPREAGPAHWIRVRPAKPSS
jgi:hypothetical protein